jgi:type I restriction enzyme, S subunit
VSNAWPMVPLGRVIRHRKEFITIDELQEYKRCRVQLHAKGIVLRDQVAGAEIKTKEQQVCRAGEFLVAEIDAKVGGFGIVPEELDGSIVSSHYFLFAIDRNQLDRRFLDYFIRTPAFREQVAARGTTNYAAIRPTHVLGYTVPLPPLPEQRRIVAKVEELASKVNEVQSARERSQRQASSIFASAMNDIWTGTMGWCDEPLGALVTTVCGQVNPTVEPYASLPHINGESMESGTGRLLPHYCSAKEDGVTSGKYHFRAETLLYSKIRPYLRKAVIVPFEAICSADVYAFETISPKLLPRFLKYSLIAPGFTRYAVRLSGRTRMPKLNQKQLFAYRVQYPPLPEQLRIAAYLDELQAKVIGLKASQAKTQAEIDALLPSILDMAFKGYM